MTGKADDGVALRVVHLRPPVLVVRLQYGAATLALALLGGALFSGSSIALSGAITVLLLLSAFTTGVLMLHVDDQGIVRRDAFGRTHQLGWSDVRRMEVRNTTGRGYRQTRSHLVAIGPVEQEVSLIMASQTGELGHEARVRIAAHLRSRDIPVVDARSRAGLSQTVVAANRR